MARSAMICLSLFLFFIIKALASISPYIVHTHHGSAPPHFSRNKTGWYLYMLDSVSTSVTTGSDTYQGRRLLYEYRHVIHGFAASLSPEQAETIASLHGVLAVEPDTSDIRLQMTRAPGFLGLNSLFGMWPQAGFGDDVVIGFVDSGIWPESPSFNDAGLSPLNKKKWRGTCLGGANFSIDVHCNNKIVAARYFLSGLEAFIGGPIEELGEFRSPRDGTGHGTAMASIAAGAFISGWVSASGFANGTAQGIAPKARIAVYKACWYTLCSRVDVLAAIDAAILDGVDVLSVSVGDYSPKPFFNDTQMIGSLKAARRGIFAAFSAGNMGPTPSTVINSAPWVTTVGSSTVDRTYPAKVLLGNGVQVPGNTVYSQKLVTDSFPLYFYSTCTFDNNIPTDFIKGHIVVCSNLSDLTIHDVASAVKDAGGIGIIQMNAVADGKLGVPLLWTLPVMSIGKEHSAKLMLYISNTQHPVASLIFEKITITGERRAPAVSTLSARGPNSIAPAILKPDIIAPGEAIMGGWRSDRPPSSFPNDTRNVEYAFVPGTSVSCAVVAGVAALLRNIHAHWSPAAIRSAMMTTATSLDHHFHPISSTDYQQVATPLDYGAGFISPQLAADPGLIYEIESEEYIAFLCALNYSSSQLYQVAGEEVACDESNYLDPEARINYPSFSVVFHTGKKFSGFRRTVTHVVDLSETYNLTIVNPNQDRVLIVVSPQQLEFTRLGEKRSYNIQVTLPQSEDALTPADGSIDVLTTGYIIWESPFHFVQTPYSVLRSFDQ